MVFPNGIMQWITKFWKTGVAGPMDETSATTIGQLVRQRRLANNLTQRQLSELAGVGLRLVSELERGKTTLRMDAVNRVLAAFGLTLGPVAAPRPKEEEGE